MFTEIEREYRKGLIERRFWRYYWRRAILAIILASVATVIFGFPSWAASFIIAGVLIILVIIFFIGDAHTLIKKRPAKAQSWKEAYRSADQQLRLETLLRDLKHHQINTKDEIRLAIDYYQAQRPISTRTSLLEFILSIAIAIMSVLAITYDDQLHTIDSLKLTAIFWPTIKIILIIIIPLLVITFIIRRIFESNIKIDSILIEDLSYIYVNFEKYRSKLNN